MRAIIRKFFPRLFFRLFYLGSPPWDSGITPPELEEFIQNHAAGRAIDLGCGTGTNVITLAQNGWEVRGVDFVPRAVIEGRRKALEAQVEVNLQVGDVTNPKFFEGMYDLVLDIGCYHTLDTAQRKAYRDTLTKHISPSGIYLLYAFTGEAGEGHRFTPEDLEAFRRILKLARREDSMDNSGPTSAWFWFQAKTK